VTREKNCSPKTGCFTCHRYRTTQAAAPNLVARLGKPVLIEDGRTVTADEKSSASRSGTGRQNCYAGFKPVHPTFQGQLSDEKNECVSRIRKSVAGTQSGTAAKRRALALSTRSWKSAGKCWKK